MIAGPRLVVLVATLLALVAPGCSRREPPRPSLGAHSAPLRINLDALRQLGLDAVVAGRPVRVVALYAKAPDYRPVASPERDGSEGIACVDDAARAALVYLREAEATGDPSLRDEASRLLDFVVAMEQGDGELVNFIHESGEPNRTAPTSAKAMSYWAARALWALAEGARVLDRKDLIPVLERIRTRLAHEIAEGRLVGGSVTATAEALLGLLADMWRFESRHEAIVELATATAELLARHSRGDAETAPYGAFVDAPGATWHAWGARAVQALATAAVVLDRPDFARAARREADGLWARFGDRGVPAEVDARGGIKAFPQIAYGLSSIVEGYLALATATGEAHYAVRAGRAARWLLGDNPAKTAMYDPATGRTFDGIDAPGTVNRDAGAESTVEALLALTAVSAHPEAVQAMLGLRETPKALLTYWPAANPVEVDLAGRLANRFNADNPDVEVRVQPIPAGRSSEEVLLAAIVGKATPDVCSNISSALLARLVRAGGVVRLDTLAPTAARLRDRASLAMLAPFRLDGALYALPWKTNPMVLLYNVDVLRAEALRPPRTHSELLVAFERLARDADGDGRLDHWALWASLKATWFERFYDFYPLYLAGSKGTTLIQDGKIVFDNAAAVSSLEVLRRGFARKQLPLANFSGRDPFLDGTVAMKIVGPWFLQQLEELGISGLRYDVAPLPVPDGVSPDDAYTFGDVKSIAVFSNTRHPVAAARFVAFLTSPEADRMLVERAAQLPYRKGLATDSRFSAAIARWHGLATIAGTVERVRDLDVHPDIVEVLDIVSEAYEAAAVYGTIPPAVAVSAAAREASEVIRAR